MHTLCICIWYLSLSLSFFSRPSFFLSLLVSPSVQTFPSHLFLSTEFFLILNSTIYILLIWNKCNLAFYFSSLSLSISSSLFLSTSFSFFLGERIFSLPPLKLTNILLSYPPHNIYVFTRRASEREKTEKGKERKRIHVYIFWSSRPSYIYIYFFSPLNFRI